MCITHHVDFEQVPLNLLEAGPLLRAVLALRKLSRDVWPALAKLRAWPHLLECVAKAIRMVRDDRPWLQAHAGILLGHRFQRLQCTAILGITIHTTRACRASSRTSARYTHASVLSCCLHSRYTRGRNDVTIFSALDVSRATTCVPSVSSTHFPQCSLYLPSPCSTNWRCMSACASCVTHRICCAPVNAAPSTPYCSMSIGTWYAPVSTLLYPALIIAVLGWGGGAAGTSAWAPDSTTNARSLPCAADGGSGNAR